MNNFIDINCDVSTQNFNSKELYAHVFDYYMSPVDETIYSSTHHLLLRLIHFNSFSAVNLKVKEFSIGLSATQAKIYDNTDNIDGNGLDIVSVYDEDKKRFRFYVKGVTGVSSPVKIQVLYASNQCNIEFNHNTYFDVDLSDINIFKSYNKFIDNSYKSFEFDLNEG